MDAKARRTAPAPACKICGGGTRIGGLAAWRLSDAKLSEHAKHDTSPVWDRTAKRGHGAWVTRDSAAAQRIIHRHDAQ